jgi:hypothetical protein
MPQSTRKRLLGAAYCASPAQSFEKPQTQIKEKNKEAFG